MELKEIRRKIGSVNNIRELTGTLETLSALKMKRAQKVALLSRPFAKKISRILERMEPTLKREKSVFLGERKVEKILVLALSSDRGFCGSFNQNILRLAEREIKNVRKEGETVEILSVGKKGTAFFKKKGYEIKLNFFGIGDYGELGDIKPISDFLVRGFLENKFQKVYLVWTNFISTFFQKPAVIQLLPVKRENLKKFLTQILEKFSSEDKEKFEEKDTDFLVEPSFETLVSEIIPQLIEYLIYQCILESNASEHSSRMMAMRNASDNAQRKLEELRLQYNKARQEQITSELSEIAVAREFLE